MKRLEVTIDDATFGGLATFAQWLGCDIEYAAGAALTGAIVSMGAGSNVNLDHLPDELRHVGEQAEVTMARRLAALQLEREDLDIGGCP